MKLEQFATRKVISIAPDDSIDTAIGLMEQHRVHHLPVVEDRKLAGMISDRDLLLAVGWQLSAARTVPGQSKHLCGPGTVAEIMSRPVITLEPDHSVFEAATVMLTRQVHAIPLVRGRRLVGIVSKRDLLTRYLALVDTEPRLAVLREPVGNHMTVRVHGIAPEEPVQSALNIMRDRRVHHVPVTAGDVLLGIVSDRDIRRVCGLERIQDEAAQATGRFYLGRSTASEIMTTDLRTVTREATLLDVAHDITEYAIGCIPIVDGRRLAGLITDTDIVRIVARLDS